ncbi:MAG: 50S ribosomal protein L32e, partial [Nitrosopumilaceae archaeon]
MPINKEALELRKKVSQHRPGFIRQESWRYVRLAPTWRKPKGIDNHQRKQKKGWPSLVKIGYGGPKIARGLHPSGYTDNLVHTLKDLEKLDPKTDGIRFGHTVGKRKRLAIITK